MKHLRWVQGGLGLAIAGAAVLQFAIGCKQEPAPPPAPPTPPATTESATKPASRPHTKPASRTASTGPTSYLDVVKLTTPALAEAEPLAAPVTLREAARFLINDPVYLDEQGHLWITRADAPLTELALSESASAQPESEHLIRDRALFVWWVPDASGEWIPHVIAAAKPGESSERADPTINFDSAFVLITPTRRQPLGSRGDYRWSAARVWIEGDAQRMVVPTEDGVSVFTMRGPREPPRETYQDMTKIGGSAPGTSPATSATTAPGTLPASAPATQPADADAHGDAASGAAASGHHEPPQYLFAPRGIIAWIPPGKVSPGSAGAAWFFGGKWKPLTPEMGWPDHLLHVIPLRDGSVTQIIAIGEGARLAFTNLDSEVPVDRKAILGLLDLLGDEDIEKREKAYRELTAFGRSAFSVLQELKRDDVSPEAWIRVKRFLRDQAKPMLGGVGVKGDHLQLVKRLRDGGAVFYTPDGISISDPQAEDPVQIIPAWISARPGHAVEPLPPLVAAELKTGEPRIDVVSGHWILSDPVHGLRLVVEGSLFRKLLRKDQMEFTHLVGLDRRGRWLLRKPADIDAPPDRRVTTLIIDPTFVDPTPRLPTYAFDVAEADVGWDKEGWGAVRQGTLERRLLQGDWAALAEGDSVSTTVPPTPPMDTSPSPEQKVPPAPATTPPGTRPATTPATAPASTRPVAISPARLEALGPLLLSDDKQNRYFGGVKELVQIDAEGREITWPLPEEAQGSSDQPVTLLKAKNGRLYLFNQTGKVHRIKPTPAGTSPFTLEATFTKDIPGDTPKRIWLDPAGRIVMAMDHKLVVLFPDGFIPQSIRERMTSSDDDDD